MTSSKIEYYHFHIYYKKEDFDLAKELVKNGKESGLTFSEGNFHLKTVGPHPMPSVQLSVEKKYFQETFEWFLLNRGKLDLFCHPVTGNDLLDHTDFAFFLGNSYSIKTDLFS